MSEEQLARGSYCKVKVNHRTNSLNPLEFNKPGWIDGTVVSRGAKRTQVSVNGKTIQKRNRFVTR